MKYMDFEGNIEDLVSIKLKEIEEKENVTILYAVESGSRAWGFASIDSDYDIRFIYVRKETDYLRLDKTRDVIEWQLDEVLDINGWDLKKVLQQIHKSNGTLFEWINSPIVYRTSEIWESMKETLLSYFSKKVTMYHYYGTANSNYSEICKEEFSYKKYFYILRPILACKWIMEKNTTPPVLFSRLLEIEKEPLFLTEMEKLLEIKMTSAESQKGKRIDFFHQYIDHKLAMYKLIIRQSKDDRKMEWEELNALFCKILVMEK